VSVLNINIVQPCLLSSALLPVHVVISIHQQMAVLLSEAYTVPLQAPMLWSECTYSAFRNYLHPLTFSHNVCVTAWILNGLNWDFVSLAYTQYSIM
jgi:hypothetical protein